MGATQSTHNFCCQRVDFSRDPSKKNFEVQDIQRMQQKINKKCKGKIFTVSEQNSSLNINSSLQLYSILGKGYLEKSNTQNKNTKQFEQINRPNNKNIQISQPHRHKVISRKDRFIKNNSKFSEDSNSFKLASSKLIEQQENSLKIKPLSDSLPKIQGYGLRSLSVESQRPRIQSGRQNSSNNVSFTNDNFMQSNLHSHRARSRHKSIFEQTKVKKQKIYKQPLLGKQSQSLSIKLQNGDLFQGQTTQDGEFQGQGIYTLSNGSVYKGVFKEGKAHGLGMYYSVDGFKYDGEWQDNSPHGYGKAHYHDGSTYAGYFKKGKKHGGGFFSNGIVTYNGDFVEDRMQGFGIYHTQKGQIYEGEWLNNMKHGKGLYKWPNGEVYEGQFKNDRKEGYGTMRYPNDSYYVGFWTNDQIDKKRRPTRTLSKNAKSTQNNIKKML